MTRLPTIAAALVLSGVGLLPSQEGIARMTAEGNVDERTARSHSYTGMWVTADGHVRHQLLPGGRYREARGLRECAYEGRYAVTGDHIDYWDDTGFTADGDFVDGVLHHGGMILYRRDVDPFPQPC